MLKRIMIASDLHGSSFYVERLINLFHKNNCDLMILLGDYLYHGPRNDLPYMYEVKKVSSLLNDMSDKIIAIRGNCDGSVDQSMFLFNIMSEYAIITIDDLVFFATHGHIYNENCLPSLTNIDVLLNGHFHIPSFNVHKDYIYVNPGSTSIPKQNSTNSCIIYENKVFNYYDLNDNNLQIIYMKKEIV